MMVLGVGALRALWNYAVRSMKWINALLSYYECRKNYIIVGIITRFDLELRPASREIFRRCPMVETAIAVNPLPGFHCIFLEVPP